MYLKSSSFKSSKANCWIMCRSRRLRSRGYRLNLIASWVGKLGSTILTPRFRNAERWNLLQLMWVVEGSWLLLSQHAREQGKGQPCRTSTTAKKSTKAVSKPSNPRTSSSHLPLKLKDGSSHEKTHPHHRCHTFRTKVPREKSIKWTYIKRMTRFIMMSIKTCKSATTSSNQASPRQSQATSILTKLNRTCKMKIAKLWSLTSKIWCWKTLTLRNYQNRLQTRKSQNGICRLKGTGKTKLLWHRFKRISSKNHQQ